MSANESPKAKFCCPTCQRTIFNRRNDQCEFCGATLPKELLLTKAEIDAIDRERCEADKRRRELGEQQGARPVGPCSPLFVPPDF